MQYALYITVLVAAIGGGTFLMATLTVVDDRKVREERRGEREREREREGEGLSLNEPGWIYYPLSPPLPLFSLSLSGCCVTREEQTHT